MCSVNRSFPDCGFLDFSPGGELFDYPFNLTTRLAKFIIFQQNITEPLKCPLQCSGTSDKTDAHKSFLMSVEQFQAINALPTSIFFGSSETPASFASHAASWHKSCHLK